MIAYDEGITSLVDSYRLLDRSGTPPEGIRYILNGQARGWVSEGLTEPHIASLIVRNFNTIMDLMRPLGTAEARVQLDVDGYLLEKHLQI